MQKIASNPDKPELTIEYSIDNIQLFEDGENMSIQFLIPNSKKLLLRYYDSSETTLGKSGPYGAVIKTESFDSNA